MKVAITIEDTPQGATVDTVVLFNGINDGGARSVALGAAVSCGFHLDKLRAIGALNIQEVSGGARALLPAPRR